MAIDIGNNWLDKICTALGENDPNIYGIELSVYVHEAIQLKVLKYAEDHRLEKLCALFEEHNFVPANIPDGKFSRVSQYDNADSQNENPDSQYDKA